MLREASGIKRIILACGRTDLRKGLDSLAALVRLAYGLDPLEEGTLFLFCGVKKDRLKGIVFEGIGFCLLTTMEQYHRLMDGFAVESSIRSYKKAEDESPQKVENSSVCTTFPCLKNSYKTSQDV